MVHCPKLNHSGEGNVALNARPYAFLLNKKCLSQNKLLLISNVYRGVPRHQLEYYKGFLLLFSESWCRPIQG